jgi:peptide/nickel transport system substrate-binding protein
MDEPPYGLCVQMPTAWFNLAKPGLDNVAVRKAIALAVDYDSIIANAMTGQSPSFSEVPRSVMNPTAGEQALYNQAEVADLQWAGNDIAGANALLDEAGILDTDGDGWREIDGVKRAYNACAPNGWTDWMAAMEIVAAAGADIGIDISTYFPEWDVYQTVFTQSAQMEYDIFMWGTNVATPSEPWGRVRNLMSSEFNGMEGNWSGNYGHYTNARIDEIIAEIPLLTDTEALKALYTEATEIYLTDVPSFSLMYRPDQFHVVNESVWTGYTEAGDGNNRPPGHSTDGYAIADLYNIYLVNE